MESFNQKQNKGKSATQNFLDILEVKDDTIIMKSGALRSVVAVSAINYDLKSSDEQDAIVMNYQNFLNSLDFPIQIIVSSRRINLDKYLDFLNLKEKEQPSELLKFQISEYKNFISKMISVSNIMEKNFYIIVPFSPIENKKSGFFSNLLTIFNPQKRLANESSSFNANREQLFQRVDHIVAGLSGIGLKLIPLKSQELIELLFKSYNPTIFNIDEIAAINDLDLN